MAGITSAAAGDGNLDVEVAMVLIGASLFFLAIYGVSIITVKALNLATLGARLLARRAVRQSNARRRARGRHYA